MSKRKGMNLVEWAMHYRQIVLLIATAFIVCGVFSLDKMRKNEFPDFTVRQGVVVAVYPGATAAEVEEQLTKPLEDYIFSFKEVKKSKTHSTSKDGMAIIQVQLNDELTDKDAFWSKFKHGVQQFKSKLPKEVLALQVQDDFGDTSALLITLESDNKTYRELHDYMDDLTSRLRTIEAVGRLNVFGMQYEQISIYIDNERLSHYGISDNTLAATLFAKGIATGAGRVKTDDSIMPVYVAHSMNSVREISNLIVLSTPDGSNIRLGDVARVEFDYPEPDSRITNNGTKCLVLSVEMKKGKNIVKMGEEVNAQIEQLMESIPDDVKISRVTDQSKVVGDSVANFLEELLIAIVAVVIVIMLLLPLKVALVAACTIPITIFISLTLFFALGIELNTVTLAALIVTLGMIVDNSIVIIDSYIELIGEGMSRWHASIHSAKHFFKSILSATLAISITFFPFLLVMKGMFKDFLLSFPWAISIVLLISLMVAELMVPFLQYAFIRKAPAIGVRPDGKKSFSMLDALQRGYNRLLRVVFSYPRVTISLGVLSVVLGAWLLSVTPIQLMPTADRFQFAVEIYLPEGAPLERTEAVADSLEKILSGDERIVSVTSFKGCSSPRFQTAYAPQFGGTNYAQFIVNTVSDKATIELLDEYAPRYGNYFADATVRFKQLSYSEATYPVEVRLSSNDREALRRVTDSVQAVMMQMPSLVQVRNSYAATLPSLTVALRDDEAARLGVSNFSIQSGLQLRYGSGISVATLWDDDYPTNVVLKSTTADSATVDDLSRERIAVAGGISSVPLRQVADIVPSWTDGQRTRRNGVPTVTVFADMARSSLSSVATAELKAAIEKLNLPDSVRVTYGGDDESNEEQMPDIISALSIAVALIFLILLWHFKRVKTVLLLMASLLLCVLGTALGMKFHGISLSVTCFLGIISLMGILVRNSIIMIDYAEELRSTQRLPVRDAIYLSAERRMRPIFLTSAAASMGVIPMILGGSGLWMPMGCVIFHGTIITMLFILTVIPVAYWLVMRGTDRYTTKTK